MNKIPKYLRNPTFGLLGLGSTGMLFFMYARQRIDAKLSHPVIDESLSLLESNLEVFELTGSPLIVKSRIRNTASIAPGMMNFSYTVQGPRGTLKVELAACSKKLKDLGQNDLAKLQVRKEGGFETENIAEFNYNDYYIPSKALVKEIEANEDGKETIGLETEFWKIEYLYAEVEENLRVMIAPKEKEDRRDIPVLSRATIDEFKHEQASRSTVSPNFRHASSKEEIAEMHRYRTRLFYQKIAYTRFYMLYMLGISGMAAYITFRKNKRLPIVNGPLFALVQKKILANLAITQKLGPKIHFVETTVGARIENGAEFEMTFAGEGHYGVAKVKAEYNEKIFLWEIEKLEVELFGEDRQPLEEKLAIDL